MINEPKLSHKHKSIILNVFEEYKDVMLLNGLYDSELQQGIEEVTDIIEDLYYD